MTATQQVSSQVGTGWRSCFPKKAYAWIDVVRPIPHTNSIMSLYIQAAVPRCISLPQETRVGLVTRTSTRGVVQVLNIRTSTSRGPASLGDSGAARLRHRQDAVSPWY